MAKRARFAWTLSESSDGDDDEAALGAADLDPGIEGDFEVPHEELSAEDCGRTCANYLIQLKDSGILRANHVCIIAYWASRAGAKMMEELSYPPGRQTGKYSRHYNKATGASLSSDNDFYHLPVQGWNRADATVCEFELPVVPVQQVLQEEVDDTPDVAEVLATAVTEGQMPPVYTSHPVVLSSPGEVVLPFALYLDGVSLTRTDGVIAFFVHLCLPGWKRRHLVASVRKSDLCGCGCGGWHTYFPILTFLAWGIATLARGVHAGVRHDGTPWLPRDAWGKSFSGVRMAFKAVCCWIKCDIMEMSTRLGFPGHGSTTGFCCMCDADRDDWASLDDLGPDEELWHEFSLEQYNAACARCEHYVTVTSGVVNRLRGALAFEAGKRRRGRILQEPVRVGGVQLEAGDRLEPSAAMILTCQFDSEDTPFSVCFWRASAETRSRHRNPLFDEETYLRPSLVCVDWLHCLSLGIFQMWISLLIYAMARENVYRIAGTAAEKLKGTLATIVHKMDIWAKAESRAGRPQETLQALSTNMLSVEGGTMAGLKGGETNSLLLFLVSELDGGVGRVLNRHWVRSGHYLKVILLLLKEEKQIWGHRFARDLSRMCICESMCS